MTLFRHILAIWLLFNMAVVAWRLSVATTADDANTRAYWGF